GPSSRPEGRDEEEGNAPVSEYGKSKLAAEEFLKNEKSLPWVILRPGAVYGPRDRDVFKVFRMAARGWFFMPGREERMASFIYVADLVNAIILAAEHPSAVFRTYLLAYPETVSWKSFAERIAGLAGKRLKTVPVPLPAVSLLCRINSFLSLCTGRPLLLNSDKEKEMRPLCWTARPEKFIIETGFKYEFSARRAVPATWDWYRRAGWLKD
ncbi:MAG TPA: NAD-dependent epimerase/dehydratase family protein, partial [bacterium]|nr:NAD-dependent epimerase/dehydratase family protein [bacterium]